MLSLDDTAGDSTLALAGRILKQRMKHPPDNLHRLPVEHAENCVALWNCGVLVLGDVRTAVANDMKAWALNEWTGSRSQSCLASPKASILFQLLAQGRWQGGQSFALRLLTDTLHFRVSQDDDGKTIVEEMLCSECKSVDNAAHLLEVDSVCNAHADEKCLATIVDWLKHESDCKRTITETKSLTELLSILFPDVPLLHARCGLLDKRDWTSAAKLAFLDCSGLNMDILHGSLCKLLFESVFELWCSRHDWIVTF